MLSKLFELLIFPVVTSKRMTPKEIDSQLRTQAVLFFKGRSVKSREFLNT